MNPGKLTITLSVTDLNRSLEFYQKLGFWVVDGGHISSTFRDTEARRWRILESGDNRIGLFQGVFPKNILTFHPGNLEMTQINLKRAGISLMRELDEQQTGSILLQDPDGNPIMFGKR